MQREQTWADKTIASIIKDFLACNAEGKGLTAWADATREKLKGLDIYSEDGDVYPPFDAHLNLLCKEPDKPVVFWMITITAVSQ